MLTFQEKEILRLSTGWSPQILDYLDSVSEAKVYIKAGLKENLIDGRAALIRNDIDWSAYNCRHEWLKRTLVNWERWCDYNNADLIGEGFPPRDSNGDPYVLHHIGQKQSSPFAELTWAEHMSSGNNVILHRMGVESEIDRTQFDKEKSEYWMARFRLFSEEELDLIYK